MAFVKKTEEDQEFGGQQPQSPAPGGVISGGSSTQQAQQPKTTGSSGLFTPLQRFVKANVPQAQQLAGVIEGRLGERRQQAQQALQSAEQGAIGEVRAGVPQSDAILQRAISSPTSLSTQERTQLGDVLSGKLKGPQSFQDTQAFSQFSPEQQRSQQELNLPQTAAGRRELIGRLSPNRPFSTGRTALDELLLRGQTIGTPQAPNVEQAQQRVASEIQRAQEQAKTQAGSAKTALQRAAEQAQQSINEKAALVSAAQRNAALQRSGGKAVDLPGVLPGQVASASELAKMDALRQLAGLDPLVLPGSGLSPVAIPFEGFNTPTNRFFEPAPISAPVPVPTAKPTLSPIRVPTTINPSKIPGGRLGGKARIRT